MMTEHAFYLSLISLHNVLETEAINDLCWRSFRRQIVHWFVEVSLDINIFKRTALISTVKSSRLAIDVDDSANGELTSSQSKSIHYTALISLILLIENVRKIIFPVYKPLHPLLSIWMNYILWADDVMAYEIDKLLGSTEIFLFENERHCNLRNSSDFSLPMIKTVAYDLQTTNTLQLWKIDKNDISSFLDRKASK